VDASGDAVPQISLGGRISGGSTLQVEGIATYTPAGGIITAGDVVADPSNPWYADAAAFMQSAPGIAAALGSPGGLSVQVVPGIEVDSPTDLVLQADWDLSTWRFAGVPGILTLRAGGNLQIQASLSDGFAGVSGPAAFVLPTTPGPSWSYRLVAGAALGSADPLEVIATRSPRASSMAAVTRPRLR